MRSAGALRSLRCVYQFGIYSSTVVDSITGGTDSLYVIFGWNIIIKYVALDFTMCGDLQRCIQPVLHPGNVDWCVRGRLVRSEIYYGELFLAQANCTY